ncbi:ABC transporter ATP-binding protein/permease [Chloroflexi bacterium TSY]|nr:ABC transporter ATP-binding protein/permease [Chloroflexi bacterium TSY]
MRIPLRAYGQLLVRYLKPQWRKVTLLFALLFASIGLMLVTPRIVRGFIDMAAEGAATTELMHTALLFLVVTLFQQLVRLGSAYFTEDVKWQATNWLRNDLADHCMRLDMSFHNESTPGAMIERIDGDVEELSRFFSQFIVQILGNLIFVAGVLILLFMEDWRFGATFTGLCVTLFLLMTRTINFAAPFWKRWREAMSEQYGLIEEWLGGTEDIRANGGVRYVLHKLQGANRKLYQEARTSWVIGDLTWGLNTVFYAISIAAALGLGGLMLRNGEITIGTVYLVMHYGNMLHWPIHLLARELKDMQTATAAIMRIQELFVEKPKVRDPLHPIVMETGALSVELDKVTFGYNPEEPVLKDLSFHLEPGKVMGLLGRTGSGKTTITRMLFRLYDPDEGAVCLGGDDLRTVALDDLRSRVGMVTQEVQLFQATVRDNLTFFDPAISDEQIIDALHLLGLQRWYESLDEGLDTWLTAGGKGLSAGEAQLLAFTRVFLKDPGLVILDEASSRLDPATEQLIEQAIDKLLHNRTAIIVAHRLATVQRADEILILQNGEIAEHGDRVALMANAESRFSQLLRTGMEEVLV